MEAGLVTASSATSPADALLLEWGLRPAASRLAVHPGDEMLAFLCDLHEGDSELALCSYLRSGAAIARLLLDALGWRFGRPGNAGSVLDFACGYGRVTRFLLDELPPERLTVADVLPGAVAFQRGAFGVRAVTSSADPAALSLPERFDAILVSSLFTHLPEARFHGWLAALVERLAPGGILVFSTHDLGLLPITEESPPADGFKFMPQSEIPSLPGAEYGSTFADEGFVRAALARLGRPLSVARFPRALCNYQDIWVVVPEVGVSFDGLRLSREPEVLVEECALRAGELEIAGWASSPETRIARVELVIDGAVNGASTATAARPDLEGLLGGAAASCGWRCRASLAGRPNPQRTVLLLRAIDEEGRRHVVWAGRLGALLLATRGLELREAKGALARHLDWSEYELGVAHRRLAAMQASRFWKVRNAWFALKRALRLTTQA